MGDLDDTKPQRKCRACRGTGRITLLISRTKCPDCEGTGISSGRFGGDDEDLEFDDEDLTPPHGTKV